MLGAILVILTLIAGAAYVAKIGTGFTLLFIGAVVFMAYKRLPLIAFTVVFTLLLAGYTYIAPPAGIWKGFLWVLLAALWLFNLRPLRKAIISRPFLRAYMRGEIDHIVVVVRLANPPTQSAQADPSDARRHRIW